MSDTEAGGFHPLAARWFEERFGSPTDVQVQSWKAIQRGSHTLIAAPTGSGKTLAALLPCLSRILWDKETEDSAASTRGVKLLYITPLKALNNDIQHHVIEYIAEFKEMAEATGSGWQGLSVGVRTGDTPQRTRASMLRNPPDVLVTTPESLYLLLTSPKGRVMLKTVLFCVVDEIHDLAAGSRGLHLSVSLERLTEWIGTTPQRIGVSATQKPIERIARFLGGWENASCFPRTVEIIESTMAKKISLQVTLPEQTLLTADKQEAVWRPLTEHIVKLIQGSQSVLIFVNNRRLCERLTLRLNDHVGFEMARSHHGSLSREQRLEVERALKAGELRCLVATSSLELGIDVGHIDAVLQIDSPKSAAAGIQRIGRAGHSVGDESRGVIVARTRGQLPECAVLARRIASRDIEDIQVPRYALDVLCQQIVAMVAADECAVPQLLQVFERSYGYHGFPVERLESVLRVLSGYYPFVRPLLDWNRETGLLTRRSSTAMSAIMGAGTIPQGSAYPVHHAESRIHLGELDEEYIHESRVGDVFQLGTSSWRIQSIRNDRVYVVEESGNTLSEIPFWRGEGQGRSFTFSTEIGAFLEHLEKRLEEENKSQTIDWLMETHFMEAHAADELLMLIHSQKAVSAVPTHRRLVIEQFQDDLKQHHLIIHSWFGRTFNRTWQLAIQLHVEHSLPYRIYANAKDNGIEFIISDGGSGEALRLLPLIREVTSDRLEGLLRQVVPSSPQFGIAFRRLAETSLLLSRSFNRMPAWQKRLRSEELLRESLPYAEQFPFIGEAIRLILHEELDVAGVREALKKIETGQLEVLVKQAAYPSPFAALFLADFINTRMYESDEIGRDVQSRLQAIDRSMAGQWFGDAPIEENPDGSSADTGDGGVAEVQAAQPTVTESGELFRMLKRNGERSEAELSEIIPEDTLERLLDPLKRGKRICQILLGGGLSSYWICAEEAGTYLTMGEDLLSARFIATRYIDRQSSFTKELLMQRYGLEETAIEALLQAWQEEGRIEAVHSKDSKTSGTWIIRQAANRHNRKKAMALRKAAEAVDPVSYCMRTMALQHVLPHTRLSGEEGLRQVIAKLQGYFCPLSQWESSIFPLRLNDYRKEMLDRLCAEGEVLWIAHKRGKEKEGSVAFFLAESKELYAPLLEQGNIADGKDTGNNEETGTEISWKKQAGDGGEPLLQLLIRKGASFLSALSRETGSPPSELTVDLLALSWRGLVSNDQFAPLRLNGGTKSAKTAKGKAFQSGLGRWYALSLLKEGSAGSRQEALFAWIKHLFAGYGLLTKDLAALHLPWSWDKVYAALKQLETWGMLTRGLWVKDVKTLQFSTGEEVAGLRSHAWDEDQRPIVLPSTDPSNPFGLIVKWPEVEGISFARKKGNDLVIKDGRWLLWVENSGKRIFTMNGQITEEEDLYEVLKSVTAAYFKLPGVQKIVIDKWNDIPVQQSEAAEVLKRLGAEVDRKSLVIWPIALVKGGGE